MVWPEATGGHATTVLSRWWAEVVVLGVDISVPSVIFWGICALPKQKLKTPIWVMLYKLSVIC